MHDISRRGLLAGAAALTLGRPAIAQGAPLKIGLMLPFSGTFAALGENIAAAFELCLAEHGGKLGGRSVTLVRLDDEFGPGQGAAERQPPARTRPGRGADRHRAFRRGDGAGAGGARARGAADHPERRQRRRHARAVRAGDLPLLVQQLAAGLWHGQGAGGEGREEGVLGHLGLCRRQGIRRGFPRRPALRRRRTGAGADAAVSRNQLPADPGAASRSRGRGGGLVLRRRRRRAVRQGLCRGRAAREVAAVRLGIPHRGRAEAAGRGGRRHPDRAALRRRPGQPEERRVPRRVQTEDRARGRCLRGAGLRRGADDRGRPRRDQGRRRRGEAAGGGDRRRRRSTARAARSRCRRRTTRCRRSICARRRAARTA